jgi:hypothetical protein
MCSVGILTSVIAHIILARKQDRHKFAIATQNSEDLLSNAMLGGVGGHVRDVLTRPEVPDLRVCQSILAYLARLLMAPAEGLSTFPKSLTSDKMQGTHTN